MIQFLAEKLEAQSPERREVCVCCGGGQYAYAPEVAEVRSNVRAFRHERFPLWRCSTCRSLHSLRKLDLAPYYAVYPFLKRRLDLWSRRVFANLLRRMRYAGLDRSARILDFGCGEGTFISFLRERGFTQVEGYDPYCPNFSDTIVLQQKYDFVIAEDVIEHVEDPLASLRQWQGLLKPGGVLLVGTPNAEGLDLVDTERGIHSLHQPYHLHILSLRALLRMGAQAGLEPTRVWTRSYCDTLWPSVNFTFMLNYLRAADNTLDAGFDPPSPRRVLASPRLWFDALFGWFIPIRSEMTVLFQRDTSKRYL